MPRRKFLDPLRPSAEPRWLKVYDAFRTLLESRRLEPGTDLKAALAIEAARCAADGWSVEPTDTVAFPGFFMTRGDQRWMVVIAPSEMPLSAH